MCTGLRHKQKDKEINIAKERQIFDITFHNGEAKAKEETEKGVTFKTEKLSGAKKKKEKKDF